MKNSSLLSILSAALILTSAGCIHKAEKGTTWIPDQGRGSKTDTQPPPTTQPIDNTPKVETGAKIDDNAPVNGTTGLPSNTDHGRWDPAINGGTPDSLTLKADTVYFDFDSSAVKASEQKKLEEVANYLKGHMDDALRVEGNCDERGTEKYNLALGDKRALAVREYLNNLGISGNQVVTVTFGALRPADPGHNEKAFAKNRRADFVLLVPKAP